jgi:hypothetical protein
VEVRRLAMLLGFREEQLEFHQVHTGEVETLAYKVKAFVDRLTEGRQ